MTAPVPLTTGTRGGPADLIAAGHRSYSFEFFPPEPARDSGSCGAPCAEWNPSTRPSYR